MLAGLVRVRSCEGRELELVLSAVRLSEWVAHGLLLCVGGDESEGKVVLGEKVIFVVAFVFMVGVGCFLDDGAGRASFLFDA